MNFNHRFPGQYQDSETGLYQNWHREYDARIGRYVESDPIGFKGGINTFAYAQNNPIRVTDKSGLAQCDLDAALEVASEIAEKMSEFVVPDNLRAEFGDVVDGVAEYLRNTHIRIDRAWYGGLLPFDGPPGTVGYPSSYELLVSLLHEILHHNFYTVGDSAANEANPNYTGPRNHAFIRAYSRALADFFKEELRKAVQKHCHCN